MSPTIELNDVVKNKLDEFKEKSGSESYSDAINICLTQLKLLEDNRKLMIEVRDTLNTFSPASQTDTKVIDALRNYVNSEDNEDKLSMFVRLIDSKANAHKLLVSQGKVREAQNVYSEWKAFEALIEIVRDRLDKELKIIDLLNTIIYIII